MFFKNFYLFFKKKTRSLYLNSNIYNKKISLYNDSSLEYKPSPSLLDCIVKYKKKKINIENYYINKIWNNKELKKKENNSLNSFFWLFSLDLKSSKKDTQNIILQWIEKNNRYNNENWQIDISAKRIIAWISNSKLTYEDSDAAYKNKFNGVIKKQINHIINEIKNSEWVDDKMICCAAIILVGLSYRDKDGYLNYGFSLLKKIIKFSFDNDGFPKSRNIRQLNFYLKYFVLIREWLKESQNEIPEYIDETIYYLGKAYIFISQNCKKNILFNGNHESDNSELDNYLKRLGYNFKNQENESGGYTILNNKKISLIMDVGSSPEKKFSDNYQSGSLSFEIFSNNKKLICNSGYFQNFKHKFNELSKSSAIHNTLILDDRSSCKFTKNSQSGSKILQGVKIIRKNIIFEKNYWKVSASHDGYLKEYGAIHNREIEFYPDQMKFVGYDNLTFKNKVKNLKFEIRFHLEPNVKVMKTQNNKSILIELDNEGWRFNSDNNIINIDNGLYFGKKNSFTDNQNIFISGMTNLKNQTIKWEITKLK
ncbi:MAG: heparinase [Candidatus Pelagibacter sp. TMED106]|nr:MAG: heparinase [Candidatus Pelagibacter sp. TMED106]|tara:strand:+ start:1383 stop:2996 length:1614 start_codon:yes stop_codon:yes gene_type:complete